MTHFDLRRQCESGVLQDLYDIHYSNLRADHNGSVTDSVANIDLKFTLKALESQSGSGQNSKQAKTMLKLKRTRLRQLVVAVCMYSLLLSPCLYHIVSMYERPQTLRQASNYLDDISLLRRVLMDIQLELRATIKNESIHESRLKLDISIYQMDYNFQSSSFILGTLIKTRSRFAHALSEIRLEADTRQNLTVLVAKYNLLTRFIHENLVEMTRQSEVTADVSLAGIDKAFEVLTLLQEVDIYCRVDCAISHNGTSLRHTYNDVIIQRINIIWAHKMALDFRGVTTVIRREEWNFLMSIRHQMIIFPNNDTRESSSQNDITCKEIDHELSNTIGNVTKLSERLFSSLTGKLYEDRSMLMQKIGVYTALFLLCVGLFGVVCALHHCIVNRLVALRVVEDTLNKNLGEEQDRLSAILLDTIPPEYIQLVINGIDKLYKSEIDKLKGKSQKKYNVLKHSFDSLIKSIKNSSVQPKISPESVKDNDFIEMYDDVDSCADYSVPLHKCVDPVATCGVFDSATLFMCDFIHLNDLVAVYEPDQLIDLVTCLIQILEARTKLYNVHILCKNIDTFSVISGSQSQRSLRHVSEIANMALDIRASCSDLEIDILPDSKLRMRISIHTSTCVYQLSSHPEPRFQIYGELVDVTTQLKNNCTANMIHISEQVGTMLRKEHMYNIQQRGFIILPNGRYLASNWLLGRRVSVCNHNNDGMARVKSFMPIQLAEKAIYRFDKEKVKYVSQYWMTPVNQFRETISMYPTPSESSYSMSDCSVNDSIHSSLYCDQE